MPADPPQSWFGSHSCRKRETDVGTRIMELRRRDGDARLNLSFQGPQGISGRRLPLLADNGIARPMGRADNTRQGRASFLTGGLAYSPKGYSSRGAAAPTLNYIARVHNRRRRRRAEQLNVDQGAQGASCASLALLPNPRKPAKADIA